MAERAKRPVVACPQCGKSVPWDPSNRFRPFCSERCKLIDLGHWAAEDYRVASDERPDEGKPPEVQ